jgi:putative ABC transport system permease protein
MDTFLKDIKYNLRMLRRSPGFTIVAVVAIALGIGATTAIFSVAYAVALRPLPYKEPDRLVKIWLDMQKHGIPKNWISEPELLDLKEHAQSFESIAAYSSGSGSGMNLTGNGNPERVTAALASADFFPVLGVQPVIGRGFTQDEDQPGKNRVVVLSHGLWQRRFASDPGIVNSDISLNGTNYTILGVMPEGFAFPEAVDIWAPLAIDRANIRNRGSHYLEVLGRLRPGVSFEQMQSEMATIGQTLSEQYPDYYDGGLTFLLIPLQTEVVGNIKPVIILLAVAVGLVLLIACFNVANMLLARATVREKEIALRAALGAGRARLVRQLLTESVLLAIIGGAIGVSLAFVGVRLFAAFGPREIPRINEIGVDSTVLVFSILIIVLTGILFGLAPALHISKPDLNNALKEGGRGSTGRRHYLRNILVVGEIAFALMLLITAGLTMRSFQQLLELDLGFRADKVMTMRLTLPQAKYQDNAKVAGFYRQLVENVKAAPGIEAAGIISQLPLSGSYSSGTTIVADTAASEKVPRNDMGMPFLEADRRVVSAGYFTSLGAELIEGRLLDERDDANAAKVVVVDEKFARTFWPGASALGKRVVAGGTPQDVQYAEIVGVVGHIHHYGTNREGQAQAYFPEGREQIYFPYAQRPAMPRTMFLAVRTPGDPKSALGSIRSQVQALDPDLPVYEEKTMGQLISSAVAQPRLNLILMAVFAGAALVLAAVGIYGVMSYSVTQRTHEIGIRMALGASSRDVLGMIVRQGMMLSSGGIALGLVGAFWGTGLLSSLLYGISATDPMTFIVISAILAGVALTACFIPAQRATRVDPMIALRHE